MELKELCEFLGIADIYITPYLEEAQITSGTLAYAMGTGKAIVSTPYWAAEELLAERRGLMIPFDDPLRMAGGINSLLSNEASRNLMMHRAYSYGRAYWKMITARKLFLHSSVLSRFSTQGLSTVPDSFSNALSSSLQL